MNYNLSLDDIIKSTKTKAKSNPPKKNGNANKRLLPAKKKPGKGKLPLSNVKKQNRTQFKARSARTRTRLNVPDARLRISRLANSRPAAATKVMDARLKIRARSLSRSRAAVATTALQNAVKPTIIRDARQTIDSIRQQKSMPVVRKVEPNKKIIGTTRLDPDGIIQRQINARLPVDNGVAIEHDGDDEMNLENEFLDKKNWKSNMLMVRRTIHNQDSKADLKSLLRMHGNHSSHEEMEVDGDEPLPLRKVTRTIVNPEFRKLQSGASTSSSSKSRYSHSHSSFSRNRDRYVSDEEDDGKTFDRSSSKSSSSRSTNSSSRLHILIISNLHENVSCEDIKELFEDVGKSLVYAKMSKNGIAEVAYRTRDDAIAAVETYHNRLLDKLPMKCTLLKENSDSPPPHTKRGPSRHARSTVAPDQKLIKNVLFRQDSP